jgi:hypothetical protein
LGAILAVFVCFPAAAANSSSRKPTQVTGVEHYVTRDRIRVVVRVDAPVQYVGGTAQDPFRIYFDLHGTQPAPALVSRSTVGDSVVHRIRVAQYRPGITRMVLDLTAPAPYTATFLANPPRLVIEILRASAGTEARVLPRPSRQPAEARTINLTSPSSVASAPPAPQALLPEQMPPVPPQVTYRNGLMTIVATNSTLSDILHAVAVRTGATVDAPADLIAQRVAARLGPASPREVMSDLLEGLDYIVVGASNDPDAIRNIILSPNSSSAPISLPATMPEAEASTAPQDESEEAAEPGPLPQPAAPEPQPSQGETGSRSAPPVKTPEELLEELRKLQEGQSKDPGR